MGFFEIFTWVVVTASIGGIIGVGMARLSKPLSKKKNLNHLYQFLNGKTKNIIKLDGEDINIKKFTYKNMDGKIINEGITDIKKKIPSDALKHEKTPFLQGFKSKFLN